MENIQDNIQPEDNFSLLEDINNWQKPIKCKVTREAFPPNNRESWVEIFIEYNTHLSSSAQVERMFSVCGNILSSKRRKMTEENFANSVFLQIN